MPDGADKGPAIRRKHGQRLKITDSAGEETVFVLRLGNGVVVDFERLPAGWRVERVDTTPHSGDNSGR